MLVSVVLVGTVFAGAIGGSPTPAVAAGVKWSTRSPAEALARARRSGRRVLVKFEAGWCGPCRRLAALLHEPEAAVLLKDMIAVRVDFDDPANREWIERYVVLGLPTVVILDASGRQVGRIMGFEDRQTWLAKARAVLKAPDSLPKLERAARAHPDDPVAVLALGKTLLVRGRIRRGLGLIERASWLAIPPGAHPSARASTRAAEIEAEALFVLGRYHHRVRRKPEVAQHVWRELATRFPRSPEAAGAWWWYARAQQEIGRPGVGVAALLARIRSEPGNRAAVVQLADFVLEYKLVHHARLALAAIDRVLKAGRDPGLSAKRNEIAALLRGLGRKRSSPGRGGGG